MTPNEYQKTAIATLGPDREARLLALGCAGESSEVLELVLAAHASQHAGQAAELVKKAHRPGRTINRELLKEEIGDNFWYNVVLLDEYGITLEECLTFNIDKLHKRYG